MKYHDLLHGSCIYTGLDFLFVSVITWRFLKFLISNYGIYGKYGISSSPCCQFYHKLLTKVLHGCKWSHCILHSRFDGYPFPPPLRALSMLSIVSGIPFPPLTWWRNIWTLPTLFLYLVVVNYVHLRFLGLPLDLWGVGGGGVVCKVIFRQHAASIYGFACKGEI